VVSYLNGKGTMTDFTGRSVLITGGAGAIGKTTARVFLEKGARVALVDLSPEALEATAAELSEIGEVITIAADVSDETAVKRYVDDTVKAFGTIDVFFNNAGIEGKITTIVNTDVNVFDKVLAVNLRGPFLGLKHVLPVMIANGKGSIINTSSEAGLDGAPNLGDYVASKHGVTGLTKTAALEVATTGVRVNSIHPSPVNTVMMRRLEEILGEGDPDSIKKDFESVNPMGRYSETIEIANVVVFLASDEASFMTGAQVRIDGGSGAR
jgi:NAD(P)-dependent dehydrogenase (short-subunit alcohol dehydrogenase family)